MRIELVPAGPVAGRLAAPASKSATNRLLVVAALADGVSLLRGPLSSDDTEAMRDAVVALGAQVEERQEGWGVTGTSGRLRSPGRPIDARLSGTTMRFVTAVATLAPASVEITGDPALRRRPVGPLTEALRALGAAVTDDHGYPPVRSGGGLPGGRVVVDAAASSQFASAILLAAPYAAQDVAVEARGVAAADYIRLTAALMRAWGAHVEEQDGPGWRVAGGGYRAGHVDVEYDASAAAHLVAVAAATGGTVTVTNAAPGTLQPDAGLPELLARMGAKVERDGQALTVHGPDELAPVDVDLTRMPDQVTTVATLAALAPGTSTITGAAVTRGHETDRLAALARELAKVGVRVDERPDGLVVHGGAPRGPAEIDPHGDHRMAMAFAALAARVPGVAIADPGCVAKTYPRFWDDLTLLGVNAR